MSEAEIEDPRFNEQRLAATWAQAHADTSLFVVLTALYAHEINVGMQGFYDGGWDVWLGDEMNGQRIRENFAPEALGEVGPWLVHAAEDYFPKLKQSRLLMSRA